MERQKRFFADNLGGDMVELSTAESHHALHVLRLTSGETVELFDGRGNLADGEIAKARRGKVSVRVAGRRRAADRPRPQVHLAFAAAKGKRLDWLLAKATELGAASLTPVHFERSVVKPADLAGTKRERWRGQCVAAAKQSHLNWLPEIRGPLALGAYLQNFDSARGVGLAGSVSPQAAPVRDALDAASAGSAGEVHVLVGPEGGMTDAEYAAAEAAGFVPVRLGYATLRIETACVALIAAVVAVVGP